MPKRILFFADGTWNGPGQDENNDGVPDPTNVLKMFHNIAGIDQPGSKLLGDEQEKSQPDQVAKYLHGVGDSRNPLTKALEGATGAGIITRIARGYTFVSRNYQPGDQIHLIGFSRGAYTARALGGMIATIGLLKLSPSDFDNKDKAYRYAVAAWNQFRASGKGAASPFAGLLEKLFYSSTVTLKPEQLTGPTDIASIAVWDTVGAMGIPDYDHGERVDDFAFTNNKLSDKVARGFHAVSVDEQRKDFVPTLWEPRDGVEQVWFPGAHADVGGGYPDSDLSDLGLAWMEQKLKSVGVTFNPTPEYVAKPDPLAASHRPWAEGVWAALKRPTGPRTLPGKPDIKAECDIRLAKLPVRQHSPALANFRHPGTGALDTTKCRVV